MASEIRKQVSVSLPIPEYRAVTRAARERHMTVTELIREWIKPHVEKLEHTAAAR